MAVGRSPASFLLSIPAAPGHTTTARAFAAAVARGSGVDEGVIDDLKLAVSEACSGPIDAGVAGAIEVIVRDDGTMLRCEIRSAPWTAPERPSIDAAIVDRSALVRALFHDAERIDDGGSSVTRFSTASHTAAGR